MQYLEEGETIWHGDKSKALGWQLGIITQTRVGSLTIGKLFYLFELTLHLEWMKNAHSLWLLWAWENSIQVLTEMDVFYMYILILSEVSA